MSRRHGRSQLAPVALDAGYLGPEVADWLGALGKNAPACAFALHMDPLSVLAETGASPGPIESHLIAAATVAAARTSAFRMTGVVAAALGGDGGSVMVSDL